MSRKKLDLIKSFMWLLPFCFFIAGYIGARLYVTPSFQYMPLLIGMNATQALIALSDYHLIPHIVAQKEENNMPSGTILQQTPQAGKKIKSRQSVCLVISTNSSPTSMPHYINKTMNEIQKHAKEENINIQYYHIPHIWPTNTCFAQWPSADQPITNETPIVYISAGYTQPIIWPDFVGQEVPKVIDFLKNAAIIPDIISHYTHTNQDSYNGYYITEQRPLAGSLVYIDKPDHVMVQFRIE